MLSFRQTLNHSKHILLYGALMAVLVFALKWLQWKYLITDYSVDIYNGLTALFFTILGVWVARQLTKPKVQTVVVEKMVYVSPADSFSLNEHELAKLNLTNREYDVLKRLAKGESNSEIADGLCLSLSTIKTHVSNVLMKMEVKSRAQAIEKAKRLKITP
ncbi:MAG: response regulator transcription factor [Bacteroidota bacterium]